MIRRLYLLNGLAILAVVCNHAAGWGFMGMFYWADRYRPVTVPNYDEIGTLSYYALLAIKCLTSASVPAFLFVSGFFVAYLARGSQSALNWKTVRVRLKNILVPYLIWSIVVLVIDALQGVTYTPAGYVVRLVLGGAHPAYFYIPLICQFYLLSPLVAPIARTRAAMLLVASALLQLGALSLGYLVLFGVKIPALQAAMELLFPMYAVFFSLGIVAGFHLGQLKQWLVRARWGLLAAVIVLGALAMIESEVVYHATGIRRGGGPGTFSTSLYSVAFILCFLAFYQVSIPFSKKIYGLGSASFGIYLLHPKVLEFAARATKKFAPWILAYQILFQPVLITLAVGAPLLFMTVVAKTPMRRFYRYLFG